MINIKVFEDLGYVVLAFPKEHLVDFKVYQIQSEHSDGHCANLTADYANCSEVVENISEAAVFLHGFVKWDGCSNWYFDAQESIMLHACYRKDLVAFGEVLAQCRDWAAELLDPNCKY